MGKKIDYIDIKNYINSHNDCELLTKEDDYINTHQELDIVCKCGNEFKASYKRFKGQNKQQCNDCGEKLRIEKAVLNLNKYGHLNYMMKPKLHKDFIKDVFNVHGNKYTILGKYTGNKDKILVKHNKCGYEWEVNPNNFLRGSRCPLCYGKNIKKTTEEFANIVEELVDEEYTVLGNYINANTGILMKHNECGHIWKVVPAGFIYNEARCPLCAISKGENKIKEYLENRKTSYEIQYTFKDCKNKRELPFDFYLPDYNLLIEYDGKQHFEPVNFGGCSDEEALISYKRTKKHDQIKNTYCKTNNINLIRIPYWDFDNIEDILNEVLFENDSAYFIA